MWKWHENQNELNILVLFKNVKWQSRTVTVFELWTISTFQKISDENITGFLSRGQKIPKIHFSLKTKTRLKYYRC